MCFILFAAMIMLFICFFKGSPGPTGETGPTGPPGKRVSNAYKHNLHLKISLAVKISENIQLNIPIYGSQFSFFLFRDLLDLLDLKEDRERRVLR